MATASSAPGLSPSHARPWRRRFLLVLVLLIALGFVARYVLHYYLHYGEAEFTKQPTGAPNYWRMRSWLMLHITSGALALLIGPLQFSEQLRRRSLWAHRISGRVYVAAILIACTCAIRLAVGTSFERGFGFGLGTLAVVWGSATLMGFSTARQGQIAVHKEWMVRSYVLTFAFVTFRLLTYSPLLAWLPDSEREITGTWLCWSIPLFVTDIVLQWKRLPSKKVSASSSTQEG